jgi:DsbC/DsbD-like thiol-disulfide interchange protein
LIEAAGIAFDQGDNDAARHPAPLAGNQAGEAGEIVTLRGETAGEGAPLLVALAGQTTTAVFTLALAPGYHVNAHQTTDASLVPTLATISSDLPAAVGPVRYPAPTPRRLGDETLPVYEGAVPIEVPLALARDAAPGRYALALRVRCQPCSDTECRAPVERTATLTVQVQQDTAP